MACRKGNIHTNFEKESVSYKLDLVGEQEFMCDKQGTVRAGTIFFSLERNKNHQFGKGFFVHHRIVAAVKIAEFLSDRVSYTVVRGRWFNIIFGMCKHEIRKIVTIQKTVLMRN